MEGASRDAAAARRDHGSGKSVAAVHANPKTLARAPELDAADVGPARVRRRWRPAAAALSKQHAIDAIAARRRCGDGVCKDAASEPKIFFGVFGRHARLDRVAPYLNVVLAVQTCVEINQ